MKQWLLDVLKGVVIGIANIIPGVSGGTMMIVMGIYDKLIYCINNLFKQFGSCIKILLPYGVGIGLALVTMSGLIGGSMRKAAGLPNQPVGYGPWGMLYFDQLLWYWNTSAALEKQAGK